MAVPVQDLQGLQPFDCGETSNLGSRWKRWLRAFGLFADGKGITDAKQKKALLLHTAGMAVQDVFFTLTEGAGDDAYEKAVKSLNDYFTPQVNVPYERHMFRNMSQNQGETVEQYITRLRDKATTCDFGDANKVNEQIRDQVVEKCYSHKLRLKLLEKGGALTLQNTREMARAMEESERQATDIESYSRAQAQVNKVSNFKKKTFVKPKAQPPKPTVKCFNCAKDGHKSNDPRCPARGKKCRYCQNTGHFECCCQKKSRDNKETGQKHHKTVKHVTDEETSTGMNKDYAFWVNSVGKSDSYCNVDVGGVSTKVIIDSGASCNVTDKKQWDCLKKEKIKCFSEKTSRPLYAYGSSNPLPVAGVFRATVQHGDRVVEDAEFIVIQGEGQTLLGRETATDLGLLHIGPFVNSVTGEQGETNADIVDKYPECFTGFGKLKDFQLKIPIDETVQPVVQPMRRIPYSMREPLEKKIEELERLDIIEKATGPSTWVSPVVVVPKNDNEIRLCVDMRVANKAVLRERFPIPTVDDVLYDMNDSSVFSKLDIKWAYHQLELDEQSREITTFVTHKGLYRYKRLMFGVSCAPEMYQKVLSDVLHDCEGARNIMDDIVVFGRNVVEHDERLQKVLSRLQERGFTLNPEKCSFYMDRIHFMGVVLSGDGIGPSESKVKAVAEFRRPENASEVKSFLGLVNYSARFIPNLATINEPLRKLTKKGQPFVWGSEQEESFERLRGCLSDTETLGYFDKDAKTQVVTDASPVGLGAVLVQNRKVIAYASRALSDVERRYSQTEREALGLVWACERFHAYLYGIDFELLTDHKPLECIYSPRSKPSARIERWVLRMQPYTYTVRYIPGYQNIADPLSRLVTKMTNVHASSQSDMSEEYINFVAREATPTAMTTREIEVESESDSELREIRDHMLDGQWHKTKYTEYLPVRNELSSIGHLVLRGTRIVVPTVLRGRVLQLAHEGHPGIVGMKQRLRSKVWWPGIDKAVENYCKSCHGCQLVGKATKPEPMVRTELPTMPWQHLALDLLGPLPSGESIVVLVDYYSRWFEIDIMKSTTSEKITEFLDKTFRTHGLPLSIQTDNGPQFVSDHFRLFMSENGIDHRRTTPFWPQANGEVERQNRSIMKRVKIACSEGKDWKSDLNKYLVTYRCTPHSTTGVSPSKLLYGREIRTKLPDLQDIHCTISDFEVRDRDMERKEKGKLYADKRRNACENSLKEGEKVLLRRQVRNKFCTPFHPTPFSLVSKNGNSVVIESGENVRYRRNVTDVKRFVEDKNMYNHRPESSQNDASQMDASQIDSSQIDASQNDASQMIESQSESSENDRCEKDKLGEHSVTPSRPVRLKKLPVKYGDYVMK